MTEDAFTAPFSNVTFIADRPMACIACCSPNEIVRVYKIGLINTQVSSVTGASTILSLNIYRGASYTGAYVTQTAFPHKKSVEDLQSVVCFYGGSIVANSSASVRRMIWSTDEPGAFLASVDEIQGVFSEINIMYQGGLVETAVQPLTLRQGDILGIINGTAAAGAATFYIEFTREIV